MDNKGREDQRILDVVQAYHSLLDTDAGRVVLYDLMDRGFFTTSTLAADPQQTQRNEGRRDLVCYIMSRLDQNPEEIRKFLEEQNQQRKEYQDEDIY